MSLKLTLIKKIDRFNPKWSESIKNLLIGKIDHLPSSQTDYEDETDILDINLSRCCIVGEVYDFTDNFELECRCSTCIQSSMDLFELANSKELDRFQETLEFFYSHVEHEHPEFVPRKY